MNRTLVKLVEPRWADEEQTVIHCTATFVEFGRSIPFVASERDTEEHGRDIYNRIKAGEFGPIGSYVPRIMNKAAPAPVSVDKPGKGPNGIA